MTTKSLQSAPNSQHSLIKKILDADNWKLASLSIFYSEEKCIRLPAKDISSTVSVQHATILVYIVG